MGDEGAPIIFNAANTGASFPSQGPRSQDVVVGITSWGPVAPGTLQSTVMGRNDYSSRCATNNKPWVYTKVAQYVDWMEQQNAEVRSRPHPSHRHTLCGDGTALRRTALRRTRAPLHAPAHAAAARAATHTVVALPAVRA